MYHYEIGNVKSEKKKKKFIEKIYLSQYIPIGKKKIDWFIENWQSDAHINTHDIIFIFVFVFNFLVYSIAIVSWFCQIFCGVKNEK